MNLPSEKIYKKISKIEDKYTRELFKNYRMALDDIRDILAKLYEKQGDLTWAEMAKYNRMSKLQDEISKILGPTFSKNVNLIKRLQTAEYGQAFFMHCWAVDNGYKVRLNWGLLSRKAIEKAVENPLLKIAEGRLRQDGRTKIRRAITQGLIRGDGYPQMVSSVRDAIDGNRADALRILRTEGQRAAVMGQQAQAEESRRLGIDIIERWDATLDSKTRPRHGEMDGQVKKEGGFYSPGIGWFPGPLQSNVASFDINCRCSVDEELPDDPPVIRQDQERGEAIPNTTFSKWAKENDLTVNKYGQVYYDRKFTNKGD